MQPLPRRVLFIGDSLTYFNDLDRQVKALADAVDDVGRLGIVTEREVKGGAPLSRLWKRTDARKRIASGSYDVVIIQEDLPETDVASFHDYATRFHEVIKASGATTVLLMTWPYERLGWIQTEGIVDAHREISEKLGGVPIVPAGLAWQLALAERPSIGLYADDMEHPSYAGSYLMAAAVFATLWGISPVGVSCAADQPLTTKVAAFLQKIAWDTVAAWRDIASVPFLLEAAEEAATAADAPTGIPMCKMFQKGKCKKGDKCPNSHSPSVLQEAGYDDSASHAAAEKNVRAALVSDLFGALHRSGNGLLSAIELRPFHDFLGFVGDETFWAEEFASLCAEVGSDSAGITLEGFRAIVDRGIEQGLFSTHCTSEEIQELLAARRSCSVMSSLPLSIPNRVVIVPGNGGGGPIWDSSWYGWLARELEQCGVDVVLKDMPDPFVARETKWLPFIIDHLAGGEAKLAHTIVVGHSSGAAAAMRLAESHSIGGVVLVAAYTSDLGDKNERKSGYFSRPWLWAKQQENCGFIVQFASTDDPFLPIAEQRRVRDGLAPTIEYLEFDGRSHFFAAPFWELLELLKKRLAVQAA